MFTLPTLSDSRKVEELWGVTEKTALERVVDVEEGYPEVSKENKSFVLFVFLSLKDMLKMFSPILLSLLLFSTLT